MNLIFSILSLFSLHVLFILAWKVCFTLFANWLHLEVTYFDKGVGEGGLVEVWEIGGRFAGEAGVLEHIATMATLCSPT